MLVINSSLFTFPLLLFLALFTKGPLGIIIPLAGITLFLAMKRELRRWTEFFGFKTWAVVGGLSALWFFAVYLEGGADYLNNLLFHQTVDRAVNAFHHKRPLWYYCVAALYSLAPWTLLVISVIAASLRQKLLITSALSLVAVKPPSAAVPHAVYNIGHSQPVKLMDFISAIETVTGRRAVKRFLGMQPGDVHATYADTTRLQHDFGFTPQVSLADGISRFYEWYKGYWV